jgi:glycosyltransferase involved in cell wall biosynthesis
MRIALDGLPLSEPLTGIGHYTLEIARHLASSGKDDVSLLSPRGFASSLPSAIEKAPNLHFIRPTVNPLTRHWWSIGLPRYIRKTGIEIFHGTNFEVPVGGDVPSVVTIHDLSMLLYGNTHEKKLVRRARQRLPMMARAATMIVTDSEAVRQEVHVHLSIPLERIVAVPIAARRCFHPIDVAQTVDLRKRLGIGGEFLLYVGTLEPRKNLLTLVRAFENVVTKYPRRLQLVLAGRKGWMIDDLFRYAKWSPAGNQISFTGYLSDDELCALYSSCTLFVYPSLYEGFGLPPLEAMACGAPVITSRIPSLMETVGDAALMVDPQDAHAWAEVMISLLEDENMRRHLAKKGTQRAAEFSWERAAEMTRIVYDEALARTN